MREMDMTPEIFTADYTGGPGERTFFVQARGSSGTLSYLVEKQQVVVLGEKLRDLLMLVDTVDPVLEATPARDPALRLETPIEPEWRIGTIGLAYEEDQDLVVVQVQPVEPDEDSGAEPDPVLEAAQSGARFLLRRDQVRSFVLHALAVASEGRDTCPLCGLPMDPGGHRCPASNGHHLTV